jgi:mannose-6-phosphate isomerase
MCNETDRRPWGYYEILSDGLDHKVKRITVDPGKRLSLQRHRRRAEHWFVLRGEAVVMLGEKEFFVKSGDSVNIPEGEIHRIANGGLVPLIYIEVQTGAYFGEDDIERIEDDYGRI